MFSTDQGLNSHLSQARSCAWYRNFQKTTALEQFNSAVEQEDLSIDLMQRAPETEGCEDLDAEQVGELLQEYEEDNDIFHFVHLEEQSANGVAGPGPSTQANRDRMADRQLGGRVRVLDDGDLSMIEVEHPTGGALIRMDQSLHQRWCIAHNLPVDAPMDGSNAQRTNLYAPFASEMDWRIAEWVVKDNIGHNTFNRLLQIPGVCTVLFIDFQCLICFRSLKSLDCLIVTLLVFTNRWIQFLRVQVNGRFAAYVSRIVLKTNSSSAIVMLSRLFGVYGVTLPWQNIWFTGQSPSSKMKRRPVGHTLRCGLVNGGNLHRCVALLPCLFFFSNANE